MRQSQVVNLNKDDVLAFNAEDVIADDTQIKIPGAQSPLYVSIAFVDLGDGSTQTATGISMSATVVAADPQWWTVDIADILVSAPSALLDGHKYVASVSEPSQINKMRTFKIHEFSVDNDGFEDTWMRLPYQVEIDPDGDGKSYLRWYDSVANFDDLSHCKYWAYAYMNGTGTTYADRADRVTHRGPITAYVAP